MLRFLVGRFFYTDAVNTFIIVMAVLAVRAMGLSETQYYLLGLAVTVVTIIASFGWGLLVDRIGPKRTLMIVLGSWAVGLVIGAAAVGMPGTTVGVALLVVGGMILGSGLGGVWVSDRVFLIRLAPAEKIGEFFGLYGLVGKASQVVGQLAYGVVIYLFLDTLGNGAYQLALLSLLVTMVVGLWLIRTVSDHWGESDAAAA
jgi:UMF1 family MFS transporter